jgi:PAS domain S-box-containing protein
MAGLMGSDKLQADESEAYFRNLLESAPDAMIIVDDTGGIAIVNGQAERMFGFDRAEMLGNKIEMLLPDSARKSHVSHRTNYTSDPNLRPMGAGMELVGRRHLSRALSATSPTASAWSRKLLRHRRRLNGPIRPIARFSPPQATI